MRQQSTTLSRNPHFSREKILSSTSPTCHLCSSLVKFYGWTYPDTDWERHLEVYRRLCFHKDCDECVGISRDSLCRVCSHMRLGHIIRCGLYGYDLEIVQRENYYNNALGLYGVDLILGRVDEVQERSDCSTCGVFAPEIARLAPLKGVKPDAEVTLSVRLEPGSLNGVDFDFQIEMEIKSDIRKAISKYYGTIDPQSGNSLISIQRPDGHIDWGKVSGWLRDCDTGSQKHRSSCYKDPVRNLLPGFRVIDVKRRCVQRAPPFCTYAALSYVWGGAGGSLQALTSNIDRLTVAGSLADDNVSAVIRHAMIVCDNLRVRYLWVDRICILQDEDIEKKSPHLDAMGMIYNHAYVTLVALAGDNAEYGLPGVDRRPARWTGTTQGLYLLNEKAPYPLLVKHSKWTTRGWTFQESMLSQRLLMFSDMGLFYECNGRHGYRDEETGSVDTLYKAQIGLTNYRKLIYEYTSKDLTFESDILRAFTGILHAVYGTDHYFGIPFEEFTYALLWYTKDGKYPPRITDGDVFPSWTWLSTSNTVKIDRDIWPDWKSSTASLAIWAIPSGNKLKCVPNISKKRSEVGERDVKEHLQTELAVIIAWQAGCFPEKFPAELGFNRTWRQYEDAINENWSSLADICDAAQGIDARTLVIKNMKIKFPLYQCCQPGHTMVHTQSLCLRIQSAHHNPYSEYTQYGKLRDASGTVLGWIDEETANYDLINLNTEYDVIALFLRCDADVSAFDPHVNGSAYSAPGTSNFHYPAGFTVSESTQLIVYLMVVKTEDGISERVALAKSHFNVWIDAKPKFGTFTLA